MTRNTETGKTKIDATTLWLTDAPTSLPNTLTRTKEYFVNFNN
jgi:hypothetical protein